MIADSLGVDDSNLQTYTKYLEKNGVIKFLKLLNSSNEVTIIPALHDTLQRMDMIAVSMVLDNFIYYGNTIK